MTSTEAERRGRRRFETRWLEQRLREAPGTSPRELLAEGDRRLSAMIREKTPSSVLVHGRARLVDRLLIHLWRRHLGRPRRLVLVAVGGYGRGELHPHSDVDLLILLEPEDRPRYGPALEAFLTDLWDMGLDLGHGVRSLEECATDARDDISFATNLMESRRLAGSRKRFEALRETAFSDTIWSSRDFFQTKLEEQRNRHAKYHDTAYKLEPNLKGSPGGLRDIQMVGWVAKRHFGARTLHDLVRYGFLSRDEYRQLLDGQHFLWRLRWLLHEFAGRREDRLLFDHQLRLAETLGYRDNARGLAVEQFMQRYYRVVMKLNRLNEMLLQLFNEAILLDRDDDPEPINDRFQIRNRYLEVVDREVFRREPAALLELFHVLQQRPGVEGVSAATIRLVREARELIDTDYRKQPEHQQLFLAILREPRGVTHELRRMNRYGVLGRYIPEFGQITGRMQYDLFHTYTVDEHTLFVVSNLRRFALPRFDHEFPECSQLMQDFEKPELAYLAGLFHDIAKGRGGDHSELGARDAEHFCRQHGLSDYDTRLVAWLVRHHLLLSFTAQKRDISDPRVIHEFAEQVGDQRHLDYLYVLTVADVRATNPELWNSWKASLFSELYTATTRALRRGLVNPFARDELIAETQRNARSRLEREGLETTAIESVWAALPGDYFLRHSAEEIAWQTAAMLEDTADTEPLVRVRRDPQRGGATVFVCTPSDDLAFARSTAALEQLGLTVQDARIVSTHDGRTLYTWIVLETDGGELEPSRRGEEILATMRREARRLGAPPKPIQRRVSRRRKVFSTPTSIHFSDDERNQRTILEIMTGDRPGLLTHIAEALRECRLRLQNAKITTVGERAEDVFFITDTDDRPVQDPQRREALSQALRAQIDQTTNATEARD